LLHNACEIHHEHHLVRTHVVMKCIIPVKRPILLQSSYTVVSLATVSIIGFIGFMLDVLMSKVKVSGSLMSIV